MKAEQTERFKTRVAWTINPSRIRRLRLRLDRGKLSERIRSRGGVIFI